MSPPVLEAAKLEVRFEGVVALGGVSLVLEAGEVRGLIGPNGSGKSTLLRCLAGALPARRGSVLLLGRVVDDLGEDARVRAGVARTFQRIAVMPNLPVRDHVLAGTRVRQADASWAQALFRTPKYRAGESRAGLETMRVLESFGLAGEAARPPAQLSTGRQRLLQVATAAATGPVALLLDEPSAGMGAAERQVLRTALSGLAAAGTAILLVEHNLRFLAGLASVVTVLDEGRVVAAGAPAEVAADPRVRRAYLGAHYADLL